MKRKRVPSSKRSRFNVGPMGENSLVTLGIVIVVAAICFAGWTLASKYLFKPDASKVAAEQKVKAETEGRWAALQADGIVLKVDEKKKDLFVDQARWEALGLSGQNDACKAAAAHYGWKTHLVWDAATGAELGWFTEREGYKVSKK